MPKWISVEEAAAKYGINKEVIWLWADMKRFPMSYEKGITTVDEESLIGFLHQNKDRVTAEYIDTLEDLCIGKTKICILYAEIIGYQDKFFAKYEKNFSVCWMGRLCAGLRRLIR